VAARDGRQSDVDYTIGCAWGLRGGVGCRRAEDHTMSLREGDEKSMNTTLALDSADSPLLVRAVRIRHHPPDLITLQARCSVLCGLGGLDAAWLPIYQVLLEVGETDLSEDLVIRCAKRPQVRSCSSYPTLLFTIWSHIRPLCSAHNFDFMPFSRLP
jgi:hypothetical protein